MMNNNDRAMPDIFSLVAQGWKKILLFVLAALMIASIILLLRPKKYLAITTALPASPYGNDKAAVFNANIQLLYPSMGTADELDKLVGTGRLDTVYKAIVDSFHLEQVYKTATKNNSRLLAAEILKDNTQVIKSDFGELKVKVWQHDPQRAATLANAIMDKIQQVHRQIQNAGNQAMLHKLQEAKSKKEAALKAMQSGQYPGEDITEMHKGLINQISEFDQLMGQYELMAEANPDVIHIVEYATAPAKHDKPKYLLWLGAIAIASFLFVVLLLLLTQQRKSVSDQQH